MLLGNARRCLKDCGWCCSEGSPVNRRNFGTARVLSGEGGGTPTGELGASMAQDGALFYGDNLDVLRRHVDDESVDLIYLVT